MVVLRVIRRRSRQADPSAATSAAADPAQGRDADAGPSGRPLGRQRRDLYSDDPAAMSEDRLGRERLADQVARILQTVAEHSESSVAALVGSWGSGKTTLVDEVRNSLAKSGWYVTSHNPWAYSDYAGAVAGFFSAIRDAVPDDVLGRQWRESLGGWVSRAAPIGAAGGMVGVDASGTVGLVGALIAGDRSPEKLRAEAADGLAKLEHPILVVLDDLDRLDPDELLLTFKLVRLLGRLPNVYYLVAYDEETLLDILMRTDLVGEAPGRAQQYLEKMVQIRLDVPPLLIDQQLDLINAGVDDLCETHGIELHGDATARLQQAWSSCLVHYLDQPRAVKRLLTQIDAFWGEVAEEVDFVDYLLVTFLRTFEKASFDLVVERRAELLGETLDYELRNESHGRRWERWQALIEDRRPRNPQAVGALLSEMFLVLRSARENMTYDDGYKEDIRRRRGIGSAEYFDRYVQLGVPAGDLPDKLVAAAAAQLRNGRPGPELEELERWFEKDASRTARKIARIDELDPLPAATTLLILGRHYLQAWDQQSGIFGSAGGHQMRGLGCRIMDRCGGPDGVELLTNLARSGPSSLRLASDIVRRAKSSDDEQGTSRPWLDEAADVIAQALKAHLRETADKPLERSPDVAGQMYAYRHLAGDGAARALLWELLESPHWTLEDLLGSLIPVGTASNGRRTWQSMGDFSGGDVEVFLGIDRVLQELGSALDGPSEDWGSVRELQDAEADLPARTAYALASLRRIREERREAAQSHAEAATAGAPDAAPDGFDSD